MAKTALSTLLTRTLSGAVFVVVMVGGVLLSRFSFVLLMLVICVGAMHEFYKMASLSGLKPQRGLGLVIGAALVAFNFLIASYGLLPELKHAVLALFGLSFVPFAAELYRKTQTPLANIGSTLTGIIYVAVPLSLLCHIAMFPASAELLGHRPPVQGMYHPWFVLAYLLIVWSNDVGAYLVGVAIGRHRLFERISPKKSLEGFFGGLLVACGVGLLLGWLLYPADAHWAMLFWGGLAIVAVIAGVLGDLVESMFKRAVNIKDSGAIMPGHGGFLDRFDALIYSLPFVFIYFMLFA